MGLSLTNLYVDPSIAADSGAGTVGDPYGDLEYCMEQEDWVAGGIQVNIKAGTDEIVAVNLATAMADVAAASKSVAWVPTETGPLVIRGYTSAANDGGQGCISGGGSVAILVTTLDYIWFVDMELHNTGANQIFYGDNYSGCVQCKIHNSTHANPLRLDTAATLVDSYVYDFPSANQVISFLNGGSLVENNIIVMDNSVDGISVINASVVQHNIIICDADISGGCIVANGDQVTIKNNSIYSSVANTGLGIEIQGGRVLANLSNNVIEGFSGVGGVGISGTSGLSVTAQVGGGNAFYNCSTNIDSDVSYYVDLGDDEALAASPFTDAATNDFSPVDTGNMKEGSRPQTIGNGEL